MIPHGSRSRAALSQKDVRRLSFGQSGGAKETGPRQVKAAACSRPLSPSPLSSTSRGQERDIVKHLEPAASLLRRESACTRDDLFAGLFFLVLARLTRHLDGLIASDLVAGDFNGDGKPDLADGGWGTSISRYGSSSNSSMQAALSNGDSTFDTSGPYFAGSGNYDLAVLDFNGDGRHDLAFCAPPPNGLVPASPTTVSVLLNTSEAAPSPAGIGAFNPGTGTWYLRTRANAGGPDGGAFRYGAPGWLPVVGDGAARGSPPPASWTAARAGQRSASWTGPP
jgi:hypothetical protein